MKTSNVIQFPEIKHNQSVPQTCADDSDGLKQGQEFVSVKEIGKLFGISRSMIYELIHHEPNFPAVNVGRKKKYVIHLDGFCEWYKNRQQRQEADVPNGFELIRRYKK
ncbi:helix-turn-helix domain-containing protein [Bacteriovoracaceae bacterium]|nr:helix-turn-helix domain-containing protein [Bacteriovoracaceae bacterium]